MKRHLIAAAVAGGLAFTSANAQAPHAGLQQQDPRSIMTPDGSVDLFFGPTAPAGKEANWVQSVPGKGWFAIFRLHGPLEPWFNKTWRPGEIEEVR